MKTHSVFVFFSSGNIRSTRRHNLQSAPTSARKKRRAQEGKPEVREASRPHVGLHR